MARALAAAFAPAARGQQAQRRPIGRPIGFAGLPRHRNGAPPVDAARIGRFVAAQQGEQGALARAVRADQTDAVASVDFEPVEGEQQPVPKRFAYMVSL